MVSADGSSQSFGGLTAQIGWFGLRVGGHPVLSLHSSNELRELLQWLCHDDSTINIVLVIIIIIIICFLITVNMPNCLAHFVRRTAFNSPVSYSGAETCFDTIRCYLLNTRW